MNRPPAEPRRVRDMERRTALGEQHEHSDADEAEALADYRADQQAGTVRAVPHADVRRRFGLWPTSGT